MAMLCRPNPQALLEVIIEIADRDAGHVNLRPFSQTQLYALIAVQSMILSILP
jgi:hypothetical protein